MNFFSAFPIVAILVTWTSCTQMVHARTCTCSETSAIRDASFAAMKRCNSRIKNYYDTHLSEDLRTNYCDGMQVSYKTAYESDCHFTSQFIY